MQQNNRTSSEQEEEEQEWINIRIPKISLLQVQSIVDVTTSSLKRYRNESFEYTSLKRQRLFADYTILPTDPIQHILQFGDYKMYSDSNILLQQQQQQVNWFRAMFVKYRDGSIGPLYYNLDVAFTCRNILQDNNWKLLLQFCHVLYLREASFTLDEESYVQQWIKTLDLNMHRLQRFNCDFMLNLSTRRAPTSIKLYHTICTRNVECSLRICVYDDTFPELLKLKKPVYLEITAKSIAQDNSPKLLRVMLQLSYLRRFSLIDLTMHHADMSYYLENTSIRELTVTGVDINDDFEIGAEGFEEEIARFDSLTKNCTIKRLVISIADETDLISLNSSVGVEELILRELIDPSDVHWLGKNQNVRLLQLPETVASPIDFSVLSGMNKLQRLQIHIDTLNDSLYALLLNSKTLNRLDILAKDSLLSYHLLEQYSALCTFLHDHNLNNIQCKLIEPDTLQSFHLPTQSIML
jgi:hypothetical protein